jgi:hypothetical protein
MKIKKIISFRNKLFQKVKNFISLFYLDQNEKEFIRFAREQWKENNGENGIMLVEIMKYSPYIFQIAYQTNFLRRKFNLKIKTVVNNFDRKHIFLNKLLGKCLTVKKLFESFGAEPGLNYYSLNKTESYECNQKAISFLKNINHKADLLKISIEDIQIGDLIYDSHLRLYNLATIDINDFRLIKTIESALIIYASCKKYLEAHKVGLILMLHAVYIQHAILVRLAISRNIPVYLYGHREGRILQSLTNKHYFQTLNHHEYQDIFRGLKNKEIAQQKAREILQKRISGEIDVGISYMRTSAYKDVKDHIKAFRETKKKRVVIFLHCFFDSPHLYKDMLFEDFHEWLDFTLTVVSDCNYDCYVKPHPNGLIGNEKIVDNFKARFPKVTFLEKVISNKQLVKEGFDLGVTLYGTIAHELAYQGIPVIAAGDNPHAAYSFCFTAKSIHEYKNSLLSPESISKPLSQKEIEQFFYMHYLYQSDIYEKSVGNWETVIRKAQKEASETRILKELVMKAKSGEFNKINTYFEDVLSNVNAIH